MTIGKVFVAGSNGFFGAHIVRALLKRDYNVTGSSRQGADLWRLSPVMEGIETVAMDLKDPHSVHAAIEKIRPDVLINSAAYGVNYAAQDQSEAFGVNTHAVSALISASKAAGVQRFVQIGSCFEYGDKDHPIAEQEVLEPTGIYGVTKAAGTMLALMLSKQQGLPLCVIRPFGLWGPLEEPHRLPRLVLEHCQRQEPLKLTGCEQVRDYLFVEDAASMVVDFMELEEFPAGEIVNMGSGQPMALREFVAGISATFKSQGLMLYGELPYRPTEMWRLVADVQKWMRLVKKIRNTSVTDGVRRMLEYADARE